MKLSFSFGEVENQDKIKEEPDKIQTSKNISIFKMGIRKLTGKSILNLVKDDDEIPLKQHLIE